ncbi:GNAT family N-acetyltransferase [uncultured Paracoccus sp.]|uniref:GNAT family N-acetyltransferase n=1 Tax=uncultured Paracoccus sp. TaxID=189685 RepID=UPI00260FF22D|nr:GNAT family N-acetyltransferase [uncultured Paracoccus sp.]
MPGWTRAHFRRLFPWEADRYAAHLKALTPQGRRWRFCGCLGDDALGAHAARAIETCHVEGCFLDGRLIGAFELFVDPLPLGHAQVALSVDPAHHHDGLGSELLARATSRASLMGAPEIDLQIQEDNAAMIGQARRAGAAMSRDGVDVGAALAVPPADPRRLSLALLQDEASLLQGMFALVSGVVRRAVARTMDDRWRLGARRWPARGGMSPSATGEGQ